ncbi:golgin subfamily B member 1-like [Periophthalmus magnuspinnatus]|uniref:golgin subfamily B member 1-like n=1 Tax=Periophthalmus magnuspinnatus TaxID=409849 RepID=UPI00243735A2|nr:golgin subfamily B member 1-like [Periophthalmus magnuspinnatus]
MLKWLAGDEGAPGSAGPPPPGSPSGAVVVDEMSERLTQTEQLVSQLKDLIREKDAALRAKDEQLKAEKEACEAKLSKLRLQNKAKVTSLSSQLEELKKHHGAPSPKKGENGDQAARGKVVLLKKKVEELEQTLSQRDQELKVKREELESWFRRGEEIDQMLMEKDKKLAEKEAYIVHLQTAMGGEQPTVPPKETEDSGSLVDLQNLVQNLTKKIGEAEERYSLLQEQTESLKELLSTEQDKFNKKEEMYKQNIQTFKDIILQKDNQLMEMNQMHEQELFKLAAKSDASADLEQLLKALKQKLHEKEEVLLGKNQVIDVLQGEVDTRDGQIKELLERLKRVQVEQRSLESKMEAERHVMKAQIRDLMDKHQSEVQRMKELHQEEISKTQQEILHRVEERRREEESTGDQRKRGKEGTVTQSPEKTEADEAKTAQRIAQLEAKVKEKVEEASKSEAKFLKIKAWSKSRIKQLEEELRRSQAGSASPDLISLQSQITALEEEREESIWKLEHYEELRAKNEMLEAKLVLYEEQQRTLQADLEQFTKRATSQASESGSADDPHSQVLEWQEMVAEAVSARDRAQEEKNALSVRISHLEEEKEALATRHQELEEELAQSRGLSPGKGSRKSGRVAERSLQEDFELDGHAPLFPTPHSPADSAAQVEMEGENMGGWWPEFSSPDPGGLRSVVEELELERNQLQEQILSLEERCQDLEDRLQLQARIETLQVTFGVEEDEPPFWVPQNETERLQGQLASVRSQQSREAEKHQLLVSSLNQQLKGLSETQETLETSLLEKETSLAQTSEKLEVINSLKGALREREEQNRELSDRLTHTEHNLEEVSKKCSISEKRCSELKAEVEDLTQKLTALKEKAQKQESTIETLQTELDQTNEDLDKLNSSHLEERAQLIHDLQSCEREIDNLKDVLCERDKEIATLTSNMTEYSDQITELKQEIRLKENSLVQVENALQKAERDAMVLRESQSSDQQVLHSKISEMVEKIKDFETELNKMKEEGDAKGVEIEQLVKQADEDKKLIQELRLDVQKQANSHRNHLSECQTHINSLKDQLTSANDKLNQAGEEISKLNSSQGTLQEKEEMWEKELKSQKDENNKLLAEVDKFNSEFKTLNEDFKQKLTIITTLERQIDEERTKYNSELQERDSEHQKIKNELQSKSENMSKLKNALKNLKSEKGQLQEKITSLNQQFDWEKQNLNQEIQDLKEVKSKFENEIKQHLGTISGLDNEKVCLNAKIAQLDAVYSENTATIETLRKENEDLKIQTGDLNKVLEQSAHSNSEILLAKTNECTHLSQVLREKEEEMMRLHEKVSNLSSKVGNLEQELTEKDSCISELRSKLDVLQNQQKQLEESLSKMEQQEENLKSELCQKDAILKEKHSESLKFENEATNLQNVISKLESEIEALHLENLKFHKQADEKHEEFQNLTKEFQKQRDDLDNANGLVQSLKSQVGSMEDNFRKLHSELETSRAEFLNLQRDMQSTMAENRNLSNNVESKNIELAQAIEQQAKLNTQVSNLLETNKKFEQDMEQNSQEINALKSERSSLQEQILSDKTLIEGLVKEKDDITLTIMKLNKALNENEILNSEKTNECVNLLREKEEFVQNLQKETGELKIEIDRLNGALSESKNQHLQLEDTVSMLQEQGAVLKSALMEKNTMLTQKIDEIKLQNETISTMQKDLDLLREDSQQKSRHIEQKELNLTEMTKELESHKDELDKRNESVLALSSQLGAMNENTVEMETELNNLKATMEKLTSEKAQLVQAVEENKAKVVDFEDSIQLLKDQNSSLKTELLKNVTELETLKVEIENYKATVKESETKISSLSDEFKLERERLSLAERANEDMLKQQQDLVQKLNAKVGEQQQRNSENEKLVVQVSELEKCIGEFQITVQNLTSESQLLKAALENKEQSSLELENASSTAVKKLSSNLQDKTVECESLKEQISSLEEVTTKVKSSLQVQISETQKLQKSLEEKEIVLAEQSKNIQDLQRREDEALMYKSQFVESTELVSKLQNECSNLRTEAQETQSAFKNLQEKYATHLEELQDVKNLLSQKDDAVLSLQKLLENRTTEQQNAQTTIDRLKTELADVYKQLENAQKSSTTLVKEKEAALASHQENVAKLTVEIDRLKSQHVQVVTQMDALTSNIEQREMALHAINNQYASQAKHTTQLVAQIQMLEEQNARLQDKAKEIEVVSKENAKLQERVRKLAQEREDLLIKREQVEESKALKEQESSNAMERLTTEKESLQVKDARRKINDTETGVHIAREEMTPLRSEQGKPDMPLPTTSQMSQMEQTVSGLEKERTRLHQDLQQCLFEIHRRDQYIQQVANKLQQVEQEKASLCAQLRQQGALYTEVAPGAPQERNSEAEAAQLSDRLQELEQSLSEERSRREAAEEALCAAEDRAKLLQSRETQRDFSIDMEPEEEWDAVSLDPNQPLLTRKVRGSLLSCRQWLRGRSLYFSRVLRSRSRAPYLFMGYLLTLHVLLLMCLTGAL